MPGPLTPEPLRVLIAPDCFGGTLTAPEAADAIAAGWADGAPQDGLDLAPLSDGGPGFLEVLASALGGDRISVTARDPLLRPVPAQVLVVQHTAYVESAQACGLHLLAQAERDPTCTSTAGVGDLIAAALGCGAGQIVVGLGGSGTNDGGAGMLDRLGLGMRDAAGRPLPRGGVALAGLDHLVSASAAWPAGRLVAATDVDNPLLGPNGATAVFARQKGAVGDAFERLEAALARLAEVVGRDHSGASGVQDRPGAGAAGGLGYGLMVLGAQRASGIDIVLRAASLGRRAATADLVVTGEGSFDQQSLHGKVVSGVARAAVAAGVPCIVLAGQVSVGAPDAKAAGVAATYSVTDEAGSVAASLANPRHHLAALARRVAAAWPRQ